ncbi:MAG: ATP-binding protein [Calditrichia bacterium]
MKIRIRLTLWYFIVTLLIVLAFSLGTYWGMKNLLYRALDQELDIVAETIERSYDPFFNEFEDLYNIPENINRYLQYYLIVYNAAGNPVFSSPMTQNISLDIPLPKTEAKKGFTPTLKIPKSIPFLRANENGEITFRVISRQMYYQNRRIGWVTVGLPIERINESMENLLNILIIGTIAAVLLIGTGGYFLTRQTLNPVNDIARKAAAISSTNLNERIKVVNPEDELGQLSKVLNVLLERLQQAFDSQLQFMADAAHELKTPLAVLRAHWEEELNNSELSWDLKEKLVEDVETISRLNHLISNLLMLSQTETHHADFEFSTIKLDELLQDVVADAQILAEIKSQQIRIVEIPETVIRGDRNRLYQLFFNIIDNAIKYTPENGKIWLSLHLHRPWATVEIRDNGPGIPRDDIPHIFERFYRVQKDRARRTGGSGLGLSICKLIVESHKGKIEVESEMEKGSAFRIKLPLNNGQYES